MASFAEHFIAWAATAPILNLTVGTTLFLGERPDTSPPACTVFLEPSGGFAPPAQLSQSHPVVQMLTRGVDYTTARDECYRIRKILRAQFGVAISANFFVFSIVALGNPGSLGQDEANRHEFNAQYQVRYEETE